MDAIANNDVKTARNIIIAEFVMLFIFITLGLFNSFGIFISIAVVLISIPVNIFWIVRLFNNRPSGFIFCIIGLLLPVLTFVGTGLWLLSAIMKIQC